jgi:hypothetical protein
LYSVLVVGWAVWCSNLSRGKIFIFQNIHSCYGVQPASYFMGAGGTLPSGKVSVGGMKLATHHCLVPMLGMSVAVVLVLLCAFLACTGTVTGCRLYGIILGVLISYKVLTSAVAGHNH